MSQVLEIPKQAELAVVPRPEGVVAGPRIVERLDRRRSPRINVQIPLFVYGYASGEAPFHEEARTLAINAHGGLLCMLTVVHPGQRLLVVNAGNEREQECEVAFVETRLARGIAVAFRFPAAMPQFWRDMEIGTPRLLTLVSR